MSLFDAILKQKFPGHQSEYKFHSTRRWRFDHSWVDKLVALEIEGGAFVQGRHTRGAGYVADMEKYSEAAILGWRILRVTPQQVLNGQAIVLLERIFDCHSQASTTAIHLMPTTVKGRGKIAIPAPVTATTVKRRKKPVSSSMKNTRT